MNKSNTFWIKVLYAILAFLFLGLVLILLPLGVFGIVIILIIAGIFGILCIMLGRSFNE